MLSAEPPGATSAQWSSDGTESTSAWPYVALGLAAVLALAVVLGFALDAAGLAALPAAVIDDPADLGFAAVLDRAAVLGRADEAFGLADGLAVRFAAVRGFAADRDRVLLAAGLAEDIDLAATVSALAAVDIALVAVFIDCMADDMVFADALP